MSNETGEIKCSERVGGPGFAKSVDHNMVTIYFFGCMDVFYFGHIDNSINQYQYHIPVPCITLVTLVFSNTVTHQKDVCTIILTKHQCCAVTIAHILTLNLETSNSRLNLCPCFRPQKTPIHPCLLCYSSVFLVTYFCPKNPPIQRPVLACKKTHIYIYVVQQNHSFTAFI